jgi:CheY-like chemotaxis protein
MHILLVEDDQLNQKITSQLIQRWGMGVTIASDGHEALEHIQTQKFDLVLMDLNLPGIDGIETTRTIRALSEAHFQNIPILAYTASTVADTKEKAIKLGLTDTVKKPLNAEELHYMITRYALASNIDPRPLRIKFDLYNGSDDGFKAELVQLMMNNIQELQHSCYKAFYSGETRAYQIVAHKVKSTLILLDDREFMYLVDDLKHAFQIAERQSILKEKVVRFNCLTEGIMKTLENEMELFKV